MQSPTEIRDIPRPERRVCDALAGIGTATISSELNRLVPVALAPAVIEAGNEHAEWEEFSRLRLSQGGDLAKYYPLTEEVREEYAAWLAEAQAR